VAQFLGNRVGSMNVSFVQQNDQIEISSVKYSIFHSYVGLHKTNDATQRTCVVLERACYVGAVEGDPNKLPFYLRVRSPRFFVPQQLFQVVD
jgi:hypothetical protein